MVGVASTSKDKKYLGVQQKRALQRVANSIYDPSTDTGGILSTPNQQSLQPAGVGQSGIPGAAPAAGGVGGPGTPGGFPGQPGTGLQPGQPSQPGPQTPQMPPDQ